MTNPEGSLTVWRCPECGFSRLGGKDGTCPSFKHEGPLTWGGVTVVKRPRMEPIPVLPLTAVQERERELVEGVGIAVRLLRAVSEGPYGDEVRGNAKREADRLDAALAAYHRRESEDG